MYHALSLFDDVTVAPAECNSIVITGEGADSVPTDGGNVFMTRYATWASTAPA